MITRFLGRLFGAPDGSAGGKIIASETYNGFDIDAAPVNEANGWRIAGTISKTIDGTERVHHFVRADTCGDAESAASITLRKAKQFIDERGERIFD
jgi:hypothetical protein